MPMSLGAVHPEDSFMGDGTESAVFCQNICSQTDVVGADMAPTKIAENNVIYVVRLNFESSRRIPNNSPRRV